MRDTDLPRYMRCRTAGITRGYQCKSSSAGIKCLSSTDLWGGSKVKTEPNTRPFYENWLSLPACSSLPDFGIGNPKYISSEYADGFYTEDTEVFIPLRDQNFCVFCVKSIRIFTRDILW